MYQTSGDETINDLSMLGGRYSPLELIERERLVLSQIAAGVPIRVVLDDLLRAIETQSANTMMTSILFLSEDGQHMEHGAGPSLSKAYNDAIDGIEIGEGIGSCGTAAARGTPVYVTDIESDPLWHDFARLALAHGLRSCWSMPIRGADNSVMGTFAIYYDEPRAPTPGDVEAITVMSQTAALAIERHRSDLRLQRSQEELKALNADLERQVHERARERSQTWLLSPDLLSIIGNNHFFESTNPAWLTTLGWTEDELSASILGFIHPDDVERSAEVFSEAISGRPILRFENRCRHKDASYRWLSWVAVLEEGKLYCSARDITVEKNHSAILDVRTRERDRAWGLSQEILVIALPDSTVEAVNGRWTEQLGWAESEILGKQFVSFLHADDVHGFVTAGHSLIHAPLAAPYEVRLRHKNGSYRWFSWTGTYEDGRVYAAGRHVTTEREQAEALRQSQKMEVVGQLTGGMAHDFNNLLTVIGSSTDLLKRPNLSEERRDRYVNAISETVKRAAKLTGQLLAFARRQTLTPQVFDVCTSVTAIEEVVRTLGGARIAVTLQLSDQRCLVNADPNQFDTALVNIVANARDAMNGEGQLSIKVEPVGSLLTTLAHVDTGIPFIAVSVSDTGTGIPASELEHIFEPFYTTKQVGQGTGLGLSQVFGFAKQSGGEVSVESVVGAGATFTLYLPRSHGEVQTNAHISDATPLANGHGTRVLVVEDNVDVGAFATQTLFELGYVTVLAASASEALMQLAANPSGFDVVFSDVVMQGMSGIELARTIRRLYPQLPVVLTSGYSHVLAEQGSGGIDVLLKPYSIEQLSRILRKVVESPLIAQGG